MQAPGFFRTLWRVYVRDTALELRSPAGIVSSLLFVCLLGVIYHYALAPEVFRPLSPTGTIEGQDDMPRRNLYGIALASLFFASTIAASRSARAETEAGARRVLLMAPADPAGYYIGKVLALWQLLLIVAVFAIPVYRVILTGRVDGSIYEIVVSIGVLGAAGLSLASLGVLLADIAQGNRLKEVLLPLLLLPASVPVFLAATDVFRVDVGREISFTAQQCVAILAPACIYTGLGALFYFTLAADD